MGAHMARNLLKNGYPVVVFDVDKHTVQDLEKSGNTIVLFYIH